MRNQLRRSAHAPTPSSPRSPTGPCAASCSRSHTAAPANAYATAAARRLSPPLRASALRTATASLGRGAVAWQSRPVKAVVLVVPADPELPLFALVAALWCV